MWCVFTKAVPRSLYSVYAEHSMECNYTDIRGSSHLKKDFISEQTVSTNSLLIKTFDAAGRQSEVIRLKLPTF